mmetsp:Transcript_22013/g.61893  ORF Transcript_22013/g.61893 Transcript_22013/m.61893 type:complete len:485 (-) Transcript_22013:154-1608(-)
MYRLLIFFFFILLYRLGKILSISSECHTHSCTGDPCGGARVYVFENLPTLFTRGFFHISNRGNSLEEIKSVIREGNWSNALPGRPHRVTTRDPYVSFPVNNSLNTGGSYQHLVYATDQFDVHNIFDRRLLSSKCRVSERSSANLFYAPIHFASLTGRLVYKTKNEEIKKFISLFIPLVSAYSLHVIRTGVEVDLEKTRQFDKLKVLRAENARLAALPSTPEWNRCGGCNHFIVNRRIGRFQARLVGTLIHMFGSTHPFHRMQFLAIEESHEIGHTDAVPYPGHVHPSSEQQLAEWMCKMQKKQRLYDLAVVTGYRKYRDKLMRSCEMSPRCNLVYLEPPTPNPRRGGYKCRNCTVTMESNLSVILEALSSAKYCYQPRGESPTRQSYFDSIAMGCIPIVSSLQAYRTYHLAMVDIESFTLQARSFRSAMLLIDREDEVRYAVLQQNLLRNAPSALYSTRDLCFPDSLLRVLGSLLHRVEAYVGT